MTSEADRIRVEPSRWYAILHARCPHCRLGHVFSRWRFPGLGVLREQCEVCGTRYAREHGYYLGAMYISSAIVMLAIPLFLLLFWAVASWSWDAMLLASIGLARCWQRQSPRRRGCSGCTSTGTSIRSSGPAGARAQGRRVTRRRVQSGRGGKETDER